MPDIPFARRGTLWTFTTQEFLPKEPYAGGESLETFRGTAGASILST